MLDHLGFVTNLIFFKDYVARYIVLSECIKISVTNRKVSKTDSMVILTTNIVWNVTKFLDFA